MDQQQREAFIAGTVSNGVRWASNILTELLGNYGSHIPPDARHALQKAIVSLNEVANSIYN